MRRKVVMAGSALAASLVTAAAAFAGTAAIPPASALPGSDPTHQAPLELLAGAIASHIAGRAVTVRCEGDADWAALVAARGGDPGNEQGFVASTWNATTGQLIGLSSAVELSGSAICLPLQRFAATATKPTTCRAPSSARRRERSVPCYLGIGRTAAPMPGLYWDEYAREATAMLALAHESVHAGGVVGGWLASGAAVGDAQAEAKAECFGLQWVTYVAERLGDSPADARAVASYAWNEVYAREQTTSPPYWSADCRPGGPLDLRPAGASQSWP